MVEVTSFLFGFDLHILRRFLTWLSFEFNGQKIMVRSNYVNVIVYLPSDSRIFKELLSSSWKNVLALFAL